MRQVMKKARLSFVFVAFLLCLVHADQCAAAACAYITDSATDQVFAVRSPTNRSSIPLGFVMIQINLFNLLVWPYRPTERMSM